MSQRPDSQDDEALQARYARYVARLESGERIDFEAWLGEQPGDVQALRRLHQDCRFLEARLEELALAAEPMPSTSPPSEAGLVEPRAKVLAPRPVPGLRIGEYRLIARLGKGGMGEVWEAVHFSLQRRVALKLLDPDRFTERGVSFFEREARAGARVHAPGIVAVHAAGETDGFLWIDQELVEGGRTLADHLRGLRSRARLSREHFHRVARLVADVARSMAVAHQSFIVHRDLKPQNILITADGRPKVTDFGLARLTDEQSVSMPGDLMGTVQYMSPEQVARGQGRIDHRTDIFSLGVVLYELLTLERPFDSESKGELVEQILYQRERDPVAVRPEVPTELATICIRALQKSPRQRFASMEQLADELERWLGGLPIQSRRPGPLLGPRLWCARHPTAAASLGVLALALALLTPLLQGQRRAAAAERQARFDRELLSLRHASLLGDLDAARAACRAAQRIWPGDPTPALLLAMACAVEGDLDASQAMLKEARSLGFHPEGLVPQEAEEHFLLGLWHFLQNRSEEGEEVAFRSFESALAGDPNHRGALFGLYNLCHIRQEAEAAARWLERYRGLLQNRDPENRLVEARLLELRGEHRAGIDLLLQLRAERSDRPLELHGLRVDRHLGRLALLEGDQELALEALERAVADNPGDAASHTNLAVTCYLRAFAFPPEEQAPWLGRARAAALRGQALARHAWRDRQMLLVVSLAEIDADLRLGRAIGPARWSELEGRIAELEQWPAAGAELSELRSERSTLRAFEALQEGQPALAVAHFRTALEEHPANLRARLFLAQQLCLLGLASTEVVLEELELALADYRRSLETPAPGASDPRLRARWEERFETILQIWIAWAAAVLGDIDRALECGDAVEEAISRGSQLGPADLLTWAEALVELPPDFHDRHQRARELVETHGLRAHFPDDPGGILARIESTGR
jgi:Flp pilus assembly protein TadD